VELNDVHAQPEKSKTNEAKRKHANLQQKHFDAAPTVNPGETQHAFNKRQLETVAVGSGQSGFVGGQGAERGLERRGAVMLRLIAKVMMRFKERLQV
jgi:hypothetical protein